MNAEEVAAVCEGRHGDPFAVLGPHADGRGDRVLEVNPRVTTSFVGHATAAATSLVRQSIDVAAGRTVTPASSPGAFQVLANGDCSSSLD